LAAVNAATGRQEVNLFFNRFEYMDEGKKIQFSAFNKVFLYDLAVEARRLQAVENPFLIPGPPGRGFGGFLRSSLIGTPKYSR
jgi:hypothetical protein